LAPAANGAAIPASHDIRDDAAQNLFRSEDWRLARRLQLIPNTHQTSARRSISAWS
jgi:hypothetical protein